MCDVGTVEVLDVMLLLQSPRKLHNISTSRGRASGENSTPGATHLDSVCRPYLEDDMEAGLQWSSSTELCVCG